jgi:hypothetical protein
VVTELWQKVVAVAGIQPTEEDMSRHMKACLFSILLALLVFGGCSSDQQTTLLEPGESTSIDVYADISKVLGRYGVEVSEMTSGDKYVPIPSPLLFASMAASARSAVANETYWSELTNFVTGVQQYFGYEVGWLIDIPDDPDPNAFYCYYFADYPVGTPNNPQVVDPYTDAIDDTIDRVADVIINHPELATERYYLSNGTWLFSYRFKYPVDDGYNYFTMYKVRLYFM